TQEQRFELAVQEQINFSLLASDPDGDDLQYSNIALPQYGQLTGNAPDYSYIPNPDFNGIDTLVYSVSDGEFSSTATTITFNVGLSYCKIYPYAIEQVQINTIDTGILFDQYPTSVGGGNYSLLTWAGVNDSNTLAESFAIPGDSENYTNPDNSNDHNIDIADWLQGAPGKNNANHVRNALDLLLNQTITVPLWSQIRGAGSNLDYQVAGFANIELTDYKLNGQSNISFIYQGTERCLNYAPVSYANNFEAQTEIASTIILSTENNIIDGISYLLATFDQDNDELSYIITQGPQHGTLSGEGPEFVYISNAGYVGVDAFSFKVNDSKADSNISTISINVIDTNVAPVADDQNITTNEDESTNIILTATDENGDSLTYQIITQAVNGTLSGTVPNLIYTPSANYHGNDSFEFITNDGELDSQAATVNISITAVNDTPVATPLDITTAEDTQVDITLLATDIDNDTLTYSIMTQPVNGTLRGTAPHLIYTADADFNGSDTFDYLVNDGSINSAVVNVTLTINPVNDAPIAHDLSFNTDEDTNVNIILAGLDVEGDLLNYQIMTQTANGQLSGTAPNLTYSPNTDFNGNDTFNYLVNDGTSNSSVAKIVISINSVNDIPIAADLSVNTNEDTAVNISLTGNDVDGDSLTYQVVTQPTHGLLSGTAPHLTYTPNTDFNGSDTFDYLVNDGTINSVVVNVTLTINPVNDAPIANDTVITTDEDTIINAILLATDIDGDALTYTIIQNPINGSLTGDVPNLIYTPNSNYFGDDSFIFKVDDLELASNNATITIAIESINDQPIAQEISVTVTYETAINLNLSGSDVEDNTLAFIIQSQASHGVITENSGIYTYQPNNGYSGIDQAIYRAIDSQGLQSSDTLITMTIAESLNDAPIITSIAPTSIMAQSDLNYQVIAQDPNMDVLEYSLNHSPVNASINSITGLLNWMPQAEDSIGLDTENLSCKIQNDLTTENDHAEIIFLVDGSGSMFESLSYVPLWVPLIDGQLNALNVGNIIPNKYGFTVFGYNQSTHIEMDSGELLGNVNELANRLIPWNKPSLGFPPIDTENMISALVDTLDTYPLTEPAAKAVIFMTDEDCDFCTEAITASTLQRLQQNNIILHGLVDIKGFPFEIFCGDGTIAMGMDVNKIGYVADGNNDFYTCEAAYFTTGLPHILDYENMRKNYT
ncbi:MAG: tandem-95 repeat protein, partial [Alcanivoracaceae bacterium]|nr:tandem-95 repeat protein [Alcanivoracaceae bacterium]